MRKTKLLLVPFAVLAVSLASCNEKVVTLEKKEAALAFINTLDATLSSINNTGLTKTSTITNFDGNVVLDDVEYDDTKVDFSAKVNVKDLTETVELKGTNLLHSDKIIDEDNPNNVYYPNVATIKTKDTKYNLTLEDDFIKDVDGNPIVTKIDYTCDNFMNAYLEHNIKELADPGISTAYIDANHTNDLATSVKKSLQNVQPKYHAVAKDSEQESVYYNYSEGIDEALGELQLLLLRVGPKANGYFSYELYPTNGEETEYRTDDSVFGKLSASLRKLSNEVKTSLQDEEALNQYIVNFSEFYSVINNNNKEAFKVTESKNAYTFNINLDSKTAKELVEFIKEEGRDQASQSTGYLEEILKFLDQFANYKGSIIVTAKTDAKYKLNDLDVEFKDFSISQPLTFKIHSQVTPLNEGEPDEYDVTLNVNNYNAKFCNVINYELNRTDLEAEVNDAIDAHFYTPIPHHTQEEK